MHALALTVQHLSCQVLDDWSGSRCRQVGAVFWAKLMHCLPVQLAELLLSHDQVLQFPVPDDAHSSGRVSLYSSRKLQHAYLYKAPASKFNANIIQ